MGYQSDDGKHEGWAPAEFPGGGFAVGSAVGGALVRYFAPGPGPLREVGDTKETPEESIDGRQAIGWRGLCRCGWRGPLWRRVATPGEHDPAGHLIYDPDPSLYGDAPYDVEDAIHREWRDHLEPKSLTVLRQAAAAARAAQERLEAAVRAARVDSRSWADIGAAVGISRQAAHERWAQLSRPAREFATGDRVRLLVAQHVSYVDEGLEDEGEDATVRFDVPSGTVGRIVRVREYPTPLPYVIQLDDGREFGAPEHDLTRVASTGAVGAEKA